MNSSDHLSKRKFNIINNKSNNLLNNSSIKNLKTLIDGGKESVTINPDLFNNKIKIYYTQASSQTNLLNTSGGSFPLLLYNSSTSCSIKHLKDNYSISHIDLYLEYLKNDDFDKVFNDLTTDKTQEILYDLYNIKQNVDECFHEALNIYEKIFKSMRLFYYLYIELSEKTNNCEKYKEDSIILNDITKLKDYIKELQLNLNEITVVDIQIKKLNIKPEYLKYIQMYGVPYKGIFDPELLQKIINYKL